MPLESSAVTLTLMAVPEVAVLGAVTLNWVATGVGKLARVD